MHDRGDSAIEGRFVPGALVFAFAEALTLGAVRIKGLAFLRSEIDIRRATFVGDTIHVESTVSALRATSKPDRATAETRNEVMNQHGQVVIAYNAPARPETRPREGRASGGQIARTRRAKAGLSRVPASAAPRAGRP